MGRAKTLSSLIMDIEQCDKLTANRLLNQLKAVWLDDIRHQRLTKQEQDKESGEPIHVHQAFMQQEVQLVSWVRLLDLIPLSL